MIAIWNDTEYNFSEDKFIYSIEADGLNLYQGKAYKFPDSDSGSVLVNKVCKDYLYTEFPALSGSTTHSGMTGTFLLKDESGTTKAIYEFVNDWNYDGLDYSQNQNLNIPVNDHTAANMYQFSTNYNKTTKKVSTSVLRAASPQYCGEFALYYTNRRNGWDAFLIEGPVVKEKDSFDRGEYDRYVKTSERNVKGEKVRYKNIVKKAYTLNTGWLKDSQAKVLARHLFSSNSIYLHNLLTDEIIPCVVTDADVEYKRYRNDLKLVSYEINVECGNKEELL